MKPRTLVALVVLGVVALAGGWYYGVATQPSAQQSVNAGKLMFPGLTARLQQTAKIEIVHQGKHADHRAARQHLGPDRSRTAIRCRRPSCAACSPR